MTNEQARQLIAAGKAVCDSTATNELGETYYVITDFDRCCVEHVLQTDSEPDIPVTDPQ